MNNGNAENVTLTAAQRWGMGLCAILTEMNRENHHLLYRGGNREGERSINRAVLKRDWGIETREELLDMLSWLKTEGHNESYQRCHYFLATLSEEERARYIEGWRQDDDEYHKLQVVQHYLFTLDRTGIAAWDEGRYVHLCRRGMQLQLLSEDEGWRRIISIAKRAQQKYDGWHHFAMSYVAGRQYWRALPTEDFVSDQMAILRRLSGNPNGPWNTLNWNFPLDGVAIFES